MTVTSSIQRLTMVASAVAIFMISLPTNSNAQIFSKKPTKKELQTEVTKLKRIIDSLKSEMESFQIPLADTNSTNDTINPGGLNFFDSADNLGPNVSTDSLLSLWYIQKNLNLMDNEGIDLDNANFKSDIPDSVYIRRLKAMNSFISLPYNDIVKNHIIFYTQKIPNKVDLILGLSNYYMPIFEEIFDQYNMPKELKIMAVIESALNPRATSRVNAKGMWQFMYRTALQYNLEINSYVDQRLDPIVAGHAAARYLKDSYTIFGDWALAIASYNCGAGNVNKAIRRAGGSRDFWKIYPYLPRETRGYVPSFVAALYTLNYYKEHGITPRAVQMPAHVDTFKIHRPLHFGQISEVLGIPKEEISNLNPQYINEIIPASEKGYILTIPYNYTSQFVEKENEIYTYKDSIFFNPIIYKNSGYKSSSIASSERRVIEHKVRSGETLNKIALKYGVSVADLKSWNHIKKYIKAGQRLKIYKSGGSDSSSRANVAQASETISKPKTSKSGGYITYKIKSGDTLWEISKKFEGVSLNDIMELNGLTKKSKIVPGKVLKIKPV